MKICVSCAPNSLSVRKSLGNHLLNLYFNAAVAERHGYDLNVPRPNEIESVLNLKNTSCDNIPQNRWAEGTAFTSDDLETVIINSKTQYERSQKILEEGVSTNTIIEGNFWHADLHSNLGQRGYIGKFFEPKPRPIPEVDSFGVIIHLRGTDFNTHQRNVFPNGICLPKRYYEQAVDLARQKLGSKVRFTLFSDDYSAEALDKLPNLGYNTIHQSYDVEWELMRRCKYLIASNSTFCWTASLFGKEMLIQPKGGYNWELSNLGSVPYGFAINSTNTSLAQINLSD